jgi:hypothetical protein
VHARRCFGALEGLVDERAYGRIAGAVGRRETPRAAREDAHADAAVAGAVEAFDLTVLEVHPLLLALDPARVRVLRATDAGGVDEVAKREHG